MEIKSQHIVALTYNLYITENGKEKLRESATESRPLVFCQGEGLMLPKFEENLQGKHIGDDFDFVLPCVDAYGEYVADRVLELDKSIFNNADGKFDYERVYEGNVVQMQTVDGDIINAQIVGILEKTVKIDLNHPLAGKDLHFVGKVLDVRPATEQELEDIRNPRCGGCGGKCSGDCNSNEGQCAGGCSEGDKKCQNR